MVAIVLFFPQGYPGKVKPKVSFASTVTTITSSHDSGVRGQYSSASEEASIASGTVIDY